MSEPLPLGTLVEINAGLQDLNPRQATIIGYFREDYILALDRPLANGQLAAVLPRSWCSLAVKPSQPTEYMAIPNPHHHGPICDQLGCPEFVTIPLPKAPQTVCPCPGQPLPTSCLGKASSCQRLGTAPWAYLGAYRGPGVG